MPVLSRPIKWVRKVAKSLKKRLPIKSAKRRVHCYVPKDKAGGENSAHPPQPVKRTVGVQVSLPTRDLLEELSHAGNIDVMAHTYGDAYYDNFNQNNSVDSGMSSRNRVSPTVSKTPVSKPRLTESKTSSGSTGKCVCVCV